MPRILVCLQRGEIAAALRRNRLFGQARNSRRILTALNPSSIATGFKIGFVSFGALEKNNNSPPDSSGPPLFVRPALPSPRKIVHPNLVSTTFPETGFSWVKTEALPRGRKQEGRYLPRCRAPVKGLANDSALRDRPRSSLRNRQRHWSTVQATTITTTHGALVCSVWVVRCIKLACNVVNQTGDLAQRKWNVPKRSHEIDVSHRPSSAAYLNMCPMYPHPGRWHGSV